MAISNISFVDFFGFVRLPLVDFKMEISSSSKSTGKYINKESGKQKYFVVN
jgi:hypothetical protein